MRSALEGWLFMACPEFEDRLIEWHDRSLDAAGQAAVEQHLAVCPACRQYAAGLADLDCAFAAALRHARLSSGFKARLLRRIERDPRLPSAAELAVRRRQLEAEYEAAAAELKRGVWRWNLAALLDGVGMVGLSIVLVLALQPGLRQVPSFVASYPGLAGQPLSTCLLWGTAALCCTGAILFAARRQVSRLIGF
jgi:anti-sigma factor RsiW